MGIDFTSVRSGPGFQVASLIEGGISVLAPAAPTLVTDGVSLAGMTGLSLSAATSDGASTFNAAGQFNGYWLPPGSTVWLPLQDAIYPMILAGLKQFGWIPQLVGISAGRFAIRPSGIVLVGGGSTVDITYRVQS